MPSHLEEATRDYWSTSLVFYQGVGSDITTSQAINLLRIRSETLGPHRRVKWKLLWLQDRIIQGKKRNKPIPTDNVLPFRAAK